MLKHRDVTPRPGPVARAAALLKIAMTGPLFFNGQVELLSEKICSYTAVVCATSILA